MEHTQYFKKLADRERALTFNPGVARLLCETLASKFQGRVLPPVIREVCLTNVAHAYRHFGFCMFSPSAQGCLVSSLARETGLRHDDLAGWLEETAYALLEDFTILNLASGEPDWDTVDEAFFRAMAKRVVCAEPGEAVELGLDCWDVELVGVLRVAAASALEKVRAGVPAEEVRSCAFAHVRDRPDATVFAPALTNALSELNENPLRLLVWRVECFSALSASGQGAKLFVRDDSVATERRAFELAGLLSLLLPHRTPEGVRLLEESPVSFAQLEKALLGRSRSSGYFNCSLLRAWMRVGADNADNADESVSGGSSAPRGEPGEQLLRILQDSQRLGLVFEISQRSMRPSSRATKKYGLSKAAMDILRPFAGSISLALNGA
jgi:hypothetical protein